MRIMNHSSTQAYAAMADQRNKTFIVVFQLFFMHIMSALQLMDWNLFYFPHWTLSGAFLGNAIGILLVTACFYYPRHTI